MKHISIGILFIFIACTAYAEDIEPQQRPVLATAAYVQDAYSRATEQISAKQDKLTSGSNIAIDENNTISATYTTGNTTTSGLTKLYAEVGTATDGTMTQNAIKTELDKKLENTASGENALAIGFYEEDFAKQNTATGYEAIAIGMGNSAGNDFNITIGTGNIANNDSYNAVIGSNNTATSASAVIIGSDNTVTGEASIAVGNVSGSSGIMSTAIGYNAHANADGAIQLGYGTNNIEKTLNVGFVDITNGTEHNYPLLASGGVIPAGRLTGQTNGVDNNGVSGQVLTSNGNGGMRWTNIPTVPTGPNDGKYTLVWNGKIGQFVFEKISSGLECPSGTYDIGFSACVDPEPNWDAYSMGYITSMDADNISEYGLNSLGQWATATPYGVIKGLTSCDYTDEINTPSYFVDDQEHSALFTYQDANGCWCRMTYPAISKWVYVGGGYDENYSCDSECAIWCVGDMVQQNADFKRAMFGSVGN